VAKPTPASTLQWHTGKSVHCFRVLALHTPTQPIFRSVFCKTPFQFLDNVQDKCSTADDFWETGFNRPMDQQSIYEERIRLGLRNPRKKERKNEAPIKIHNGISTNLVVIASLT